MGEMGEYCTLELSIVDLGREGMVLARSLKVGSEGVIVLLCQASNFVGG
jgi:hypothetical protein